ncbi:MAG: hypothetical protein WCD76_06635 [Pyrinomonadaceae bacterium]
MRDTTCARKFESRFPGDGGGGLKAARLAVLLACCALLTACPPDGGALVPLAKSDGAQVVSEKFRDDALRVTRGGLTLTARGVWSVADGATSVILEIVNENAEALRVDFRRAEFVNNESGTRASLRSASDESGGNGPSFLSDETAVIAGREAKKFALEFAVKSEDGRAGVPRNFLGQTATLRLPLEMKADPPAQVEFIFDFKYAERRP